MVPAISRKNIISGQSGFTLIEVMVSLAIFVIAIIGCYRLQVGSSLSNTRSNSVASASTWAQYLAEDLLARQYASYATDAFLQNQHANASILAHLNDATAATADGVAYVRPDGSISINGAAAATDLYTIYWNILDNRPLQNIKQIHIIVAKNTGLNSGQLYTQDYFKSRQ